MSRILPSRAPTVALAIAAGLTCCGPSPADAGGANQGQRGGAPGGSPSGTTPSVDPAPSPQPHPELGQDALDSATRGNDFAFDLFRAAARPDGNTVASPLSVRHALALAWAGAAGQTDADMRSALRFPGQEGVEHAAMAALVRSMLATDPEDAKRPEVAFASRVWLQRGYALADGYEARVSAAYGAAFAPIDFRAAPDAARAAINQWIADQTHDRIKDLLPAGSVSPSTRLILSNAVHLNARWASPFEKEATWDQAFHVPDAEPVRVPMMHQTASMRQHVTDAYTAVELGYRGSDLSMVAVMPAPGTMAAFEASLDAQSWGALVDAMEPAEVRLSLPKFETDARADLSEALGAMGMQVAFTDRADFSRMSSGEALMIGAVFHGAFIRVDEAGTEAAAATAVTMITLAAPPMDEPVEITLDHPFLFAIRDRATGAILFLGRVTDPR